MRTARLLTGTVRAAAALGAGLALSAAPAAYADAGGGGRAAVEPRQVAPGAAVTLMTGACVEEGQGGGTVTGDAGAVGAGRFSLAPDAEGEEARGTFRVPRSAVPGTYEIVARCPQGEVVAADLVVTLTSLGEDDSREREELLPGERPEGRSGPGGEPADAAGEKVTQGSVAGVDSALGTDPVQVTAGVAALGLAAAGGTWLLHRHTRGGGL
ncbi:hypothetical protein [Streptomyces albidoflavus]|uniref:hypothetical protein n=1 Tax=Streptomyces albidoflavus TaxID=1886 RepID=UPI00101E6002|nr:hypothetical protein [Streptomyces albidoflavus]RZE90314.1 hypothetical protein C0R04_22735 [Streptomyces albidoflavus]RZE91998.1 hypothetical protein C0R03_22750 [Streptomyces albidoflavus]